MPIQTKAQTPTNRTKCLTYTIVGIILQTLIILAFVLIFMRITTPKFRVRSISIEKLSLNTTNSPSFSMRFNAQLTVKNSNFGYFKFSESEISVIYRGNTVGAALIPAGRARARRSKKMNVTIPADSKKDKALGGDLNSGKIILSVNAALKGKVHLFKVVKKKKTTKMNCTVDVNTRTRVVENLRCK